jgi:hypothetical protein
MRPGRRFLQSASAGNYFILRFVPFALNVICRAFIEARDGSKEKKRSLRDI